MTGIAQAATGWKMKIIFKLFISHSYQVGKYKMETHLYTALTYLRNFLYLHKTHATVSSNWQALMIAEAGNLYACCVTGLA